jgi:hypothetical protein
MQVLIRISVIIGVLFIAGCGGDSPPVPETWTDTKIENVARIFFRNHLEYVVFKREGLKLTPLRLVQTAEVGPIPVYEDVSSNEPMWVLKRVSNMKRMAYELHIRNASQLEGGGFEIQVDKMTKKTITNTPLR